MSSTKNSCVWNRAANSQASISPLTFEQALEFVEQELEDIFSLENEVDTMFERYCNGSLSSNMSLPLPDKIIGKGSLSQILDNLEQADSEYAN